MPSSHDSPPTQQQLQQQPVKRPSLVHRSSSTNSVSRQSPHSSSSALSNSHKTTAHKPHHRPHVVGAAHRPHHGGRNPSYGKNLNKLQRLTSANNLAVENTSQGKHHQRKKSGGPTPSTSPRPQNVRHNSTSHVSLTKAHSTVSIKKNHSTTGLKKNASAVHLKRATASQAKAPHRSSKKTVGFEIGDSDDEEEDEEDEDWEDSSHSPATTRQNSAIHTAAQSQELPPKDAAQPLTPTFKPRSPSGQRSPPASILRNANRSQSSTTLSSNRNQPPDLDAITSRLLYDPRGQKAPPAMSSISATATPAVTSPYSHSFHSGSHPDGRSDSRAQHAASSSAEGGVSRFIDAGAASTYASSVDQSAPSSFLPNYHPQQVSRSEGANEKPPKTPPAKRGADPPSRTQQKLWLQRTAALTMSPPAEANVSPAIEPVSMLRPSSRGGNNRRISVPVVNDFKQVKKLHERSLGELNTVRRFRNPVSESLIRLEMAKAKKLGLEPKRTSNVYVNGATNANGVAGNGVGGHSRNGSTNVVDNDNASGSGIVAGIKRTLSRRTLHNADLDRHSRDISQSQQPQANVNAGNMSRSAGVNGAKGAGGVGHGHHNSAKGVRFQIGMSGSGSGSGGGGGDDGAESDDGATHGGRGGHREQRNGFSSLGGDDGASGGSGTEGADVRAAGATGGSNVNGPSGSAEEALLRRMWESREVVDYAE